MASALRQRICSPMKRSRATCAISARSPDTPGSPARPTRAVARYAGLTGSPDESGRRRREKGLAKAGNARVRRGMIQFAWRFLIHQKDSALAQWYQASVTAGGKKRKTMVVALARKLLIALWRFVTTGEVPQGVIL